jgi:hypothetical protein
MPKRVIDFDAMWGSDKLASCAEWAQAEYAWLYGLADASGCFELTNLRVIWGRVAAIRRNLSLERLEQIFLEFQDKGLLFAWEENGKRYGHWTGSDVPGRLPAPSWRVRLERLAPPVPKQQLAEFMARFSRGRAASPGGGFLVDSLECVDRGSPTRPVEGNLNENVESPQAQDWKWNRKQEREGVLLKAHPEGFVVGAHLEGFTPKAHPEGVAVEAHPKGVTLKAHPEGKQYAAQDRANVGETTQRQLYFPNLNSKSEIPCPEAACVPASSAELNQSARAAAAGSSNPTANSNYSRDKSFVVARELVVGQGPRCGPVRVKPEVLERIRRREGSRSP